MLQSIALWFLKDYVGEYVENLNTDQLSIGYGGVELEKLVLKKTALQSLKLPIKVSSGFIGKFNLVIPFANPNTQPWIVRIDELLLIVEAEYEVPDDVVEEEKERLKRKRLKKLEDEWKANMKDANKGSWWTTGSWFPSLHSSFSTKIVENLQLEIKNVHFRYECNENDDQHKICSFGVKIGNLSALSTNEKWEESLPSTENNKKFKLVKLENLSLYNDSQKRDINDLRRSSFKGFQYILNPVSAEARVCRNTLNIPLSLQDGPRFHVDLLFDAVLLILIDKQYKMIADIFEEITVFFKKKENKKWRPFVLIHEDPKAWWRFAINTVLLPIKEKRRRQQKEFVLKHVRYANQYIPLYMKKLLNSDSQEEDEIKLVSNIEKELQFESIAAQRKAVFSKIARTASSQKLAKEVSTQSWSSWAMSYIPYTQSNVGEVKKDSLQMSKEEENFLKDLSEAYSRDEESLYKRDAIFTEISFTLNTGSFVLKKNNKDDGMCKTILDMAFKTLKISSQMLLKTKYYEWRALLGSMVVRNPEKEDEHFPKLIYPQEIKTYNETSGNHKPFLEILFGKNTFPKTSYSFKINLQPSTVVYKPYVFSHIKEFFTMQEKSRHRLNIDSINSKLRQAVTSRFEHLKNVTRSELAHVVGGFLKGQTQMMEDQWNVQLDVAAPRIILPLVGDSTVASMRKAYDENTMVVVNLGRIRFGNQHAEGIMQVEKQNVAADACEDSEDEFLTPSSTPPQQNELEENLIALCEQLPTEEVKEKFYDSYTIDLSMVQILVGNIKDQSSITHLKGFGPDHVVEEFSVSFLLKRRIIFTTDPELPAVIMTTFLPQLLVHIDEKKLHTLHSCLQLLTEKPNQVQAPSPKNVDVALTANKSKSDTFLDIDTTDLLTESKLFMAKFTFEKLSLGLHSRGRCFAELQLKGMECEVTKRPYDMSVSFILSSLLLIDAIQTFGQEYELLINSNQAISEKREGISDDVLINVRYEMINADSPNLEKKKDTPLNILKANFNTLFITANLETIVELKNVLNQILPKTTQTPSATPKVSLITLDDNRSTTTTTTTTTSEVDPMLNKPSTNQRIEISATFRELDILIFRVISKDTVNVPSKVSMISLRHLELTSKMSEEISTKGFIGNITIADLASTNSLRKNIFTVGSTDIDRVEDQSDAENAFTFTFSKTPNEIQQNLSVLMASAYYVHSPRFLSEIALCAGDYKQYALNLAKSIQTAASDMAKSIVIGKRNYPNSPLKSLTSINDSVIFDETDNSFIEDYQHSPQILYSVNIECPIVVFPKNNECQDFLVGHLGKIQIHNTHASQPLKAIQSEKVELEIEKINLFILNVEKLDDNEKKLASIGAFLTRHESKQIALLHNTDLWIEVDRVVGESQMMNVSARINSPIKLFLSIPMYQQILATVQFTTAIKASDVNTQPTIATTPLSSAAPSETSLSLSASVESYQIDHQSEEEIQNKITAQFQMPCLQIELHGELYGKSCGFVLIEFDHFHLGFSNIDYPFTKTTVTLQSFFIEDLLHTQKDKYRYLISSTNPTQSGPSSMPKTMRMERPSSSYPGDCSLFSVNSLSTSLPNIMSEDSFIIGGGLGGIDDENGMMETPLICVNITTADSSIMDEDLLMNSNQTRKNISIDMNNLDLVFNLQTWVILLEFFGIGASSPALSPKVTQDKSFDNISKGEQASDSLSASSPPSASPASSTDLNIQIKSLVFYLNKELYPLAKATVSSMKLSMLLDDGNQDLNGSVGNVELLDLSPYHGLYDVRLISSGEKALDFSFFRYGKPDPNLSRDHDMDLVLTMSALQYIHTQRFLMEVIAFAQHFVFLQEVLVRMRAANAGEQIQAVVNRCARLKLKVNAEAPILILPRKTSCADLLIANLGKLNVDNQFLYASDPKTNASNFQANRFRTGVEDADEDEITESTDRLLDCIDINLSDMEIYSALKIDSRKQKIMYVSQGGQMMIDPCSLHLALERNLEWAFGRQVPDMSISGHLSSVSIHLDLSQFSLIMGMLGENLGEQLDVFQAPSTIIVDPLTMESTTNQVWTTMHIKLHLSNVTLTTVPSFTFGPFKEMVKDKGKLGKFDFLNSNFIFESFSDGSKSMNLVSTDVLLHDVRNEGQTGILMPCNKAKRQTNYLQFEVHYLDTKENSRLTFLCNESRILLQFEFLLEIMNFILRKQESRLSGNTKEQELVITQRNSAPTVLTKVNATPKKLPSPAAGPKKHFELKINITESELVVVENIKLPDSRTVILKTTAVFFYRPDHLSEKPVSCSLQSLEIFSCLLSKPDDSALSIVDPVAFLVELNHNNCQVTTSTGLLDAIENKPMLEIQFQVPINIRLSYHDVQMFHEIIRSAQAQISIALSNPSPELITKESTESFIRKQKLNSGSKFIKTSPVSIEMPKSPKEEASTYPISGVELKTCLLSLTIIDDCGDNDVPLLDIRFDNILLHHDLMPEWKGSSRCHLDANYYNTRVSAWEPFLEGWRFNVHWYKQTKEMLEKTIFKVDAPERLDLNITSAFVHIMKTTANLWTSRMNEDLEKAKEKKRAPFLPFVLRNRTGTKLSFSTMMKSPRNNSPSGTLKMSRSCLQQDTPPYFYEVSNREEIPFSFEHRSKQRHQATHSLMVHQIIIGLPGWQQIKPVTVDRVGKFYRIVTYNESSSPNQITSAEDVYIIIDITLEGARKIITVHSALIINNQLSLPVEITASVNSQLFSMCILPPKETFYVPVKLLNCRLYVRPVKTNCTFEYCSEDLSWRDAVSVEEKAFLRRCRTDLMTYPYFKFIAILRRLALNQVSRDYELNQASHPEHHITLVHNITLENQLPFDLFYTLKGNAMRELVKPGVAIALHTEHHAGNEMEIGFSFESFLRFDVIRVSSEQNNYIQPVRLYDLKGRVLFLNAFIKYRCFSIQISVSAPLWLVNKTGIPLIFKRVEDEQEVAGQFDEHEEARSLTPLPFSFVGSEYPCTCQMRVGRKYRPNDGMTPVWCREFGFDKEFDSKTLYVRRDRDRYEKCFEIGITTKWGKGVFSGTKIVTFVPRYQIDNRTNQILTIVQSQSISENETSCEELQCNPGALVNYHWSPKWDRKLRVCLHEDRFSSWSGEFRIDKETTYHLIIKSNHDHVPLRALVASKNGTYRCTFTSADDFPPPYKLLNLSDVPLFYWQTHSKNTSMREFIRAKECKSYVMDEPLMPPSLTFNVFQECSETYDLSAKERNQFRKLYYQNAIFIAFKDTFIRETEATATLRTAGLINQQLVLEVINERQIILAPKAEHKISQLWRMTAEGNLVPFTPFTGKERRSSSSKLLVLDIDLQKTERGEIIRKLFLKPLDSNRTDTQTWYFESQFLKCCVTGYAVQGADGLKSGTPAILSKCTPETLGNKYYIDRQKLRPGSGVLSVRVYSIGPTQVVEVSDSHQDLSKDPWVMVEGASLESIASAYENSNKINSSTELNLSLAGGVGISLINLHPEEVIFATLSHIRLSYEFNALSYTLETKIGDVQIDNQLFGCQLPIALFAHAQPKSTSDRTDLRLFIKVEKEIEYGFNIFKKFHVDIAKIHILLEDRLLLKLIQAVQTLFVTQDVTSPTMEIQNLFESHRVEEHEEVIQKKTFFEEIKVNQGDMNVSLKVTGKLDADLVRIKKDLGIYLASFDAALMVFEAYTRYNVFETGSTLQNHILNHYKQTFKNQITTLLGSLDILGNPMGLMQDFTSGMEGLLKKGNVGGLIVNVAHGMSNSAAKMTGVIADGLWSASGNKSSNESRDALRAARTGSSSSHVSAGLKGLGLGMIGGLTSMIVEPIEGASKKGVGGFLSGLGKGIVGTVTKPVAGVLDLASGTAAAVRTSTETSVPIPPIVRLKRNCYGAGGVLGKYSKNASEGQEVLRCFNEGDSKEMYVAMETIRPSTDRLKALLTNEGIYIVRSGPPSIENIEFHVEYSLFDEAVPMLEGGNYCIEIFHYPPKPRIGMINKVQRIPIRCENERLAQKVCQKANYLKALHEEGLYCVSAAT